MDRVGIKTAAMDFLSKYRYVILVLAAGLVLMLLPDSGGESNEPIQAVEMQPQESMESRLESLLSQIRGAGKVRVLLTESISAQTVYQMDSTGEGSSKDTVIITDGERKQQGLVSRIDSPVYLGAVVVCQGGDDPVVRLAIVEAVSDATGLGADRITVLKMK